MTTATDKQHPKPAATAAPTGPALTRPLLSWYDRERRDLPWRARKGETADPYRVWLSEVMLQQTTVKTVGPYFERFLRAFPTIEALAKADLEDVLRLWSGLGYYSRARSLHACAQKLVAAYAGRLPEEEAELLELPGIGPYTAAAIASIAFGKPATPVDGNVERVVARLFGIRTPFPEAKAEVRAHARELTPPTRGGDFAQALMDLGAGICSPKSPSCLMCPLTGACQARARGLENEIPVRRPKAARPVRFGVAFLTLREDGCVLLRERPATGLLARMLEVPGTPWTEVEPATKEAMQAAPVRGDWWPVPGIVEHTFTHFKLEAQVLRAVVAKNAALTFWADPDRCRWVERRRLDDAHLPSVMKKLLAHGLSHV